MSQPLFDAALAEYTHAVTVYAVAREFEEQLEHERAYAKQDAILRLLQLEAGNPLTGKPHSATSAESVVNTDAEYQAYLARQRQAVMTRIKSDGLREAARLTLQYLSNHPEK